MNSSFATVDCGNSSRLHNTSGTHEVYPFIALPHHYLSGGDWAEKWSSSGQDSPLLWPL